MTQSTMLTKYLSCSWLIFAMHHATLSQAKTSFSHLSSLRGVNLNSNKARNNSINKSQPERVGIDDVDVDRNTLISLPRSLLFFGSHNNDDPGPENDFSGGPDPNPKPGQDNSGSDPADFNGGGGDETGVGTESGNPVGGEDDDPDPDYYPDLDPDGLDDDDDYDKGEVNDDNPESGNPGTDSNPESGSNPDSGNPDTDDTDYYYGDDTPESGNPGTDSNPGGDGDGAGDPAPFPTVSQPSQPQSVPVPTPTPPPIQASPHTNPTVTVTASPTGLISTGNPTPSPLSKLPTSAPTPGPTQRRTESPTRSPVRAPTSQPTGSPTNNPTTEAFGAKVKAERKKIESIAADKTAEVMAGMIFVLGIIGMIYTAYQLFEHPDGLYASCCRLSLKGSKILIKIMCLPCKICCGKYSGYTTSDPKNRTLFVEEYTNDLELT